MPGWTDPYDPERAYRGRGDGRSPYPAPGGSWASPGRHAAEPPGWSPGSVDDHGYGQHVAPSAGWYDDARTAYPVSGPDLPDLTENEPRRPTRPLVLAAIAAAATLLVIAGVAGVLRPSADEGVPTATVADSTAAGSDPGLPAAGGTPAELPSAAPSAPARPSTPATRPSAPAAEPTRAVAPVAPPKRKASPTPRPTRRTPSSAAPTPSSATTGSAAQQVVALVNEERGDAGCDPLTVDSKLTTAARLHSADQAVHQNMSHDGSDGSTLQQRVDRVGYEWRTIGENVAYGQTTPARVVNAWMNSEGHRRNILNCQFEDIGVGVARDSDGRLYWTQDFGA